MHAQNSPMPEPLLIRCGVCAATNRIPREKLESDLQPVCGRCKSALHLDSKPLDITDADFSGQVERSPLPVLVDMWAPWCGPCRFVSPAIEEVANQMTGRLRVFKLNVDQNPVTATRFGIQSIPALLFFKGGREVDRLIGAQPKSEILRRAERLI
jgi:thioredoxin 2